MAKYIDAEAFKAQLSDLRRQVNEIVPGMNIISTVSVSALLDDYPAADVVEVKHGRWVWGTQDLCYYCSECDYMGVTEEYSFCPNCGARMDLDKVE